MPERDANQLAADVRAYLLQQACSQEHHDALASLRELVGLAGALQQERDDWKGQAEENFAAFIEERDKAVAAEAALAHLTDKHEHLLSEYNYESYRGDRLVYAAEWDEFNEWQRNGKQALATTRQALAEIAEARWADNEKDPVGYLAIRSYKEIARRALADTGGDTAQTEQERINALPKCPCGCGIRIDNTDDEGRAVS